MESKKRKNSIYDVVVLAGRTGGICANVKREQKTEVVSSNVHVHPAFTT